MKMTFIIHKPCGIFICPFFISTFVEGNIFYLNRTNIMGLFDFLNNWKTDKVPTYTPQEYWNMRMEHYNSCRDKRLFFSKSIFTNPITRQFIYIPGSRDRACNRYFAENFNEIKKQFRFRGYDLFYLPELIDNITTFIQYNNPSITPEKIAYIANKIRKSKFDILNYAENKEVFDRKSSALISYDYCDTDTSYSFTYFELEPFVKPKDVLYKDIIDWYIRTYETPDSAIRYSATSPLREGVTDFHFSDNHFSDDIQKVITEVRDKLALLRQSGVSEMLLKELLEPTEKLSSLYIDSNYRIFLPDYNNIEIKMEPLNKAVFLLFLQHEEGIIFKHLIDYKEELAEIYEKITGCRCDEKRRKSIERICDPTNNSINEKCARIREAFVRHFDERLAKNYFVTGEWGEAKRVALSRELIVNELLTGK